MSKNSKVKIHSDRLDVDFVVHVQDETNPAHPKCYVLTVHDIGCDHTGFSDWIDNPHMAGLRERIVWLHVDLPGQEAKADDILVQYPTLDELGEELVIILDHFKVHQVVGLGEGCGANIIARFAMIHPIRCLGVTLIHPTGQTATFMQNVKEKIITNVLPNSTHNAYLIWHKFGHVDAANEGLKEKIDAFQAELLEKRNAKNLSSLIDAYLNRTNIEDKVFDLKCDVMIAVGKNASFESETKKFYFALTESRKDDLKQMVNSPLLEVDNVSDVIEEAADKLTTSMQFFLQGIGLVSAMPMASDLEGLSKRSRALSMDQADKPRRDSLIHPK